MNLVQASLRVYDEVFVIQRASSLEVEVRLQNGKIVAYVERAQLDSDTFVHKLSRKLHGHKADNAETVKLRNILLGFF